MHKHVKHIHFIGIGGSGMSGIAEVLANLQFHVSGSDIAESAATKRLQNLGAVVSLGHDAKNINDCDVVVISSAIDTENPEIQAAIDLKIPVVPRAQMLAELMRFQDAIAVAGTHGKTTTTSLIASVLSAAGLDPTFVVGGLINSAGANAKLGKGQYMVAEADESDASFLNLMPLMAVVTNIDEDHMNTYQGDIENVKKNYIAFLQNLPFYGLAVVCLDDVNVQAILASVQKPILSYGLQPEVDFQAVNVQQKEKKMYFDVVRKEQPALRNVVLNLPGEHNVLNALAAIAIASHTQVDDNAIINGLADFEGVARRFDVLGDIILQEKQVTLVDDYAHHPVELAATLQAANACWPQRRIVVVFEPHRYSRTFDLFDDFVDVLSNCDTLFIAEVYAAGETPINGASSGALCQALRVRGQVQPIYVADMQVLPEMLYGVLNANDVLLMMGAGSIGKVIRTLYQEYKIGEVDA